MSTVFYLFVLDIDFVLLRLWQFFTNIKVKTLKPYKYLTKRFDPFYLKIFFLLYGVYINKTLYSKRKDRSKDF